MTIARVFFFWLCIVVDADGASGEETSCKFAPGGGLLEVGVGVRDINRMRYAHLCVTVNYTPPLENTLKKANFIFNSEVLCAH